MASRFGELVKEMEAELEHDSELIPMIADAWFGSMAERRKLEKRLELQVPLVDVGVRIRHRSFKNSEDVFLYRGRARYQRLVPDADMIELGNEAAHRGNVEADASMFELGLLDHAKSGYLFEMLYAIPPVDFKGVTKSHKGIEIINMRATMAGYGSFSESTSCVSDDKMTSGGKR
jgi:hypothetical protein